MNTTSYKHLLTFFFFAFALIALTACGGSSGGGDGGGASCNKNTHFCNNDSDSTGKLIADCAPATHNCATGNLLPVCDPATHFCDTSGVARDGCAPATYFCATTGVAKAGCDSATYFCDSTGVAKADCVDATYFCDTSGAAKAGCDSATYFCDTSGVARDGCAPATYFCATTGVAKAGCDSATYFCDSTGVAKADCVDATYFCDTSGAAKAGCDTATYFCDSTGALKSACAPATHDCTTGLYNTGGVDSATGYEPSNTKEPPTGGWVAALATARTTEYHATRAPTSGADPVEFSAADQIGAAYAHARGHTGEGITVSVVGRPIDRDHDDITGQLKLEEGYDVAGAMASDRTATNAGTCAGSACGATNKRGTHIAGIVAGKSGNSAGATGLIQGIAYNAKIRPIKIYTDSNDSIASTASRVGAIEAASGANVAVMLNDWAVLIRNTYSEASTTYYYFIATSIALDTTLSLAEKNAWKEAVKTTVVVFANGDQGFNSVNGMVKRQIFSAGTFTDTSDEAWSNISGGGANLGAEHAIMPATVTDLSGLADKWLTVIALKEDNQTIHEYSNGCGIAQAFCLGAPGVDINSAIPGGGYEEQSGTGIAAAHVAGAVAILAEAFPSMTPAQLASLILTTADYIGIDSDEEGKTDGTNNVYGHGALNLARASEPVGEAVIVDTILDPDLPDDPGFMGVTLDNSGITLPTSFGGALDGFTVGFMDDYNRAYIGAPKRIAQASASFTLADTLATWESPELQSIALDSNSKMQFTNYDENADAKDTLIFTHNLPNHTVAFSYNEESKTPDLRLANNGEELHFQKIRPIASDLMQVNSTYKLGKNLTIKNSLTSGEFDTGNRFNEAMTNLNYTGENSNLTIGAGTLKEYGQFLGASGTGAYQLSDATSSQVTHLAISQNLPLNSSVKVKYTGFKTEVDMRYSNFAKINDLTADEYQLSLTKKQLWGKKRFT